MEIKEYAQFPNFLCTATLILKALAMTITWVPKRTLESLGGP